MYLENRGGRSPSKRNRAIPRSRGPVPGPTVQEIGAEDSPGKYDFVGGIWAWKLVCLFVTDRTLSYSVSVVWDLKPGSACSCIKDKLLCYSVNPDWVVFLKKCYITDKSTCEDSIYLPICGRTSHQNHVRIDPDTKSKLFPTPTQKPKQLRILHGIKPGSISHDEIKLNPISHWNQPICGPHPETKSTSTTHTKTKSELHHTKNSSISARTESILTPRTGKRIPIPTRKTSQIRSPTKKQLNFDATNEDNSISTLKACQFRYPETKTKIISIQTLKLSIFRTQPNSKSAPIHALNSSQFRYSHWNQVVFGPHTKTRAICDPSHWNQVNFNHSHNN